MAEAAPELTPELLVDSAVPAETEAAPALTPELLVDSAVPAEPAISPDGRLVAYAVSTVGVRERRLGALWVAATNASSPPVRLTDGTAWDRAPRWAPDSASLFFLSDRKLRRIRPDGTAADVLIGRPGEIFDHLPLADGRTVAVIADDDPDERDDVIVWGEGARGHRLRLLDLDSGALVTAAGLGDRHVVEVAQRPDGGPLAVISWACPQDEPGAFTARLHVIDPGTG
jgi:dipeptidyl aminopeptidase/acylaminoacyl peptidase